MASFSEWSNNKKKQETTERTAPQSAQSFSAWSNQKLGIEEPLLPQVGRGQNVSEPSVPRRTTSGGYYSQPEFGADRGRLETAATSAQSRLQSKQKEVEAAMGAVTEAERALTFVESHVKQLQSNYQANPSKQAADLYERARGTYDQRLAAYNSAVSSFNTLYAEYEPLLSAYNTAATAYNDYIAAEQQAYSDWRGTIRNAGDIEAEIAAIDAELKTIPGDFANFMENLGANFAATSSGLPVQWKDNSENEARRAQLEADKELLQEELDWSNYFRYADLTGAEDFAELSKYVSTANGKEPEFNAWSGMYTSTGFNDINYDIINRNEVAKDRQGVNDVSTNASFLGLDNSERGQMTDEEIAIFNYLYAQDTARGDAEHTTAYGYIDYLTGDLNYRQRQADEERWAAYASESPVGSSIFSVLESPLKGLSYIGQLADYAEDGKIDQNAGYNKFSYLNSAIRNEVSEIVEENWGGVGTFAYQTGMSMGDFLFNTAISGGNQTVALAIMGSGAAADGTIRAKDRGLTDNQAFALGTIAGAAEIITEKLSLDALLDATKLGKNAFGYFIQNTVTEGAEEVGADFINLFSDIMIAKDKSEWQQSINAYIAQGCDEDTAFWNAFTDQAINMGLDFLGGAISGAAFAGAAITGNKVTAALDNRRQQHLQTAEQMQQQAEQMRPAEEAEGITLPTAEKVMEQQVQQTAQQAPVQQEQNIRQLVQQAPLQEAQTQREPGALPTAEQAELQQRMQSASTELERTGIEAGASTETIAEAQRISQAIGRDIVFYNEAATASGIRNGYYSPQDGKIHVNTASGNPLAQIVAHEMTHSVELAESYGELSDIVLKRIQNTNGNLQQLRQQKAELYARNGVELRSEAEIDQEIVAEYVERYLLTDERSIMELTRENRTLGERILRWINDLLAKLGSSNAQERAFLTQARSIYAKALSQTSFTQQTATAAAPQQSDTDATLRALREAYANGEITEAEFDEALDAIMEEESVADTGMLEKNSFGGVNANGANLETLRQAQEMERQGVAAETIFRETGWYTGADGKWRFEMDDSQMKYSRRGDLGFRERHEGYDRYRQLTEKAEAFMLGNSNEWLTAEEQQELTELQGTWSNTFRTDGRVSPEALPMTKLTDYIRHEELFRNYPQLRNTSLVFAELPEGTRGQYDADRNIITLSEDLRHAPEDTIIHEIQHAIQHAEGFTNGSNPDGWEAVRKEVINTVSGARKNLDMWLQDIGYPEFARQSMQRVAAREITLDEHWEALREFKENSQYAEQIANCEAELANFESQLKMLNNLGDGTWATPGEMYYNTAGEIEARDAAERRTMTAEQRREMMPNTGNEQTVYAETLQEVARDYGMDYDADARYNEQTNEGGVSYGREMGNDIRGRVSAQMPGEQSGAGAGEYRADEAGVSAERRAAGDAGQDVLRADSEGRRLTEEQAQQLRRTAIVDEFGAPLAVYHFTPEMEFENFAKGDIGFHFGTREQAEQRGNDLKAAGGRMFRAYLNIEKPYRVRLDLNAWWPSHIGLYLWSDGVLTDAQWNELQSLDGHGYDTPGAQRLREMLDEIGIDGFAYPNAVEGDGDSYIALRDEQIVRTDILPVKEKFSISEPVEQTKTLLAVHNMDEEKIRRTLNLGAWPSPSIAIVEATQGHTDYGEFSAVFPRSVIDPEVDPRNKVYGSDAWTPTHANAPVEYEVNYDIKRRFDNMVAELTRNFAGGALYHTSPLGGIVQEETADSIDKIAEKLSKQESVQAAYLAHLGEEVEPVYHEKKFDNLGNDLLRQYIDNVGVQELARLMVEIESTRAVPGEAAEAVRDIIVNDWAERNKQRLSQKPELIDKYKKVQHDRIDEYRVERFIRNAWDYYEDGGATAGEIDRYDTAVNVTNRLSELSPEGDFASIERMVQKWVRGEIEGLLGESGIYNGADLYDRRGNRKSFDKTHWPVTVENIVKAMNNADARGSGVFGYTASGLVATATPEYKSVADIHADESRLRTVPEEEYRRIIDELDEELAEVTGDIIRTTGNDGNGFAERENIGYTISQAATGKRTASAIKRAFAKEGYVITTEQAQAVKSLLDGIAKVPTGYFEAKPRRVVEFDEALAVVVPDSTPVELLAAMRNAGMNVVEYEAGNTQSRLDIINNLEDAKFSISERTGDDKRKIISDLRGMLNGGASAAQLRRYVDTLDDGYTEPENGTGAAEEIVRTAHNEGMSVDEYLRRNWESYEYDGALNEDARRALELEKRQSRRRYSIDESAETEGTEDIIGTLPQKAQQYLHRTERYLLDKLGALLSVPRYAQREFLQSIVRDISTEYLQTGRVSQETIDDLFERAYDEGIEVDTEFYDTYKHIKDYLRTQPIEVNDQTGGDIPDFNYWRKSAFGTLRIVNSGGLGADVAYMELQGMAPELFPQDITHPSDQLLHMYEVAKSIQRVEKSLDEVYGHDAEEFKRWAKNDFDAAVNDVLSELRQVKRYADERRAETAEEPQVTQQEIAEMYGKLKDARRTYEKAAAKNLLTQHDEVQVGRLLRGEIELEHLDPAKDNVKGITAVYEAKQEYEQLTKRIREWNKSRKAKLRDEADGFLQTANDWKDKRAGILYSRETMERNIRDIVNDPELAEEIVGKYFKPVHDDAAKANKTKNTYRDRVRKLKLSRDVAKGNTVSEAHAVQLLGEAEDNIRMLEQSRGKMTVRDGKTLSEWHGIVQNLWAENPKLDEAKIRAAVKEFRSIYDELFKQMNEARVRNGYEPVNYRNGYFPHFQPGNSDGILAQFGKALGIDMEVAALPTTINGLTHTFKPGMRWFGNAQERIGFNTAYDAVEGFDKYIEGVADVIHQTDNIQRLRALASQTRYRTGDEGIRKQVDAVMADQTLSETDKQNRIEKIYESGRYELSNFVVELEEYTNLLANKKSRADRNMEQALGRNMYNLVKALESRVAANMVAVNPASWLTNFIPLTQGNALLERGMLLRGMWDTLKAYKADDGIVGKSSFLTNRRGSDPLVRTWAQKASAKMSRPMEYIDQFTADSLVRARYRQNLNKGLSEDAAMSEADAWVAGVMADRSKGSTPTLFNRSNPVTKVFTQFQLEVNNQCSYLFKDMPRDAREKGLKALAAALFKFFLGAFLYNEVYEYVIGRRPALDPVGILNDTVGDLTGYELPNLVELGVGALTGDLPSFETEKPGLGEAGKAFAKNVVGELPFLGGVFADGGRVPISSALPDVGNLWDAATEDDWSASKRWQEVRDELLEKPVTYLATPFGGGQLKKVFEALEAVIRGGSYSVDKDGNDILQYPVYRDTAGQAVLNAAGGMLFGKSTLPTGRDWVENGFDSLGVKETACYQAMLDAGITGEEAFALLQELGGAEKTDTESEATVERGILKESDISGEGKSIVYYGLMASDKERELMDALADGADMGEVTNVLMQIKDAEYLTGAAKSNAKREAIMEAALTDDEKKTVYRYMMGEKQEDGAYTSSRDDDIMAFEQAGMDFDQFLRAQNEYSSINEVYTGATDKAMEFSRWVNSQQLTAEQADTMRNCFTYYSQIPQEAKRYNDFVTAGLDDDTAYQLASALNKLKPLEGEDTVSSLQRYRAVVDAGLTEDEQMAVLSELMQESEYGKLLTGYSFGVTPAAYVTYKELLPKFDADGNGTFKQEEVEAAIDALSGGGIMLPSAGAATAGNISLTNAEKAALWQMANKSWKPKNNPYSTRVGQQVYDALNAEAATGALRLPSQSEQESGIQLPTAESSLRLPSQG